MKNISNLHFWIYIAVTAIALLILHFTGTALKLYKKSRWFDIVIHFLGGFFLFTPLGFWLAYRCHDQPLWLATTFAFCFGCSISALWEIIEFAIDSVFKTNLQRWKDGTMFSVRGSGLIDIMGDIIANSVSSLVACIIIPLLIVFI